MTRMNSLGEFVDDEPPRTIRLAPCDMDALRRAEAMSGKGVCDECRRVFDKHRKDHMYCSPRCRDKANRRKQRKRELRAAGL